MFNLKTITQHSLLILVTTMVQTHIYLMFIHFTFHLAWFIVESVNKVWLPVYKSYFFLLFHCITRAANKLVWLLQKTHNAQFQVHWRIFPKKELLCESFKVVFLTHIVIVTVGRWAVENMVIVLLWAVQMTINCPNVQTYK